ncbi:MAG: hypothetical protein Q8934_15530 [Bacillota bacterium]|nr:hypothetical protein [Bacillota bacterium]
MDDNLSNEIKIETLKQLFNLRKEVNKNFFEKGPASNEFILLSHDLEILLKKYQNRS